MIQTYDISQLRPYINWPYFFFAWQVKDPSEKERLRQEAEGRRWAVAIVLWRIMSHLWSLTVHL